ncbi:MAG: phosphotriesterase [Bacteroidia bacterium]|nr:MAG: phosphotriesterase [Bacteroidia bacterium]
MLWLILFLVFGIVIITCKPIPDDYVMTVNGPESPGKMGVTLEHEHILVDFIGADSTGYLRWNRDSVIAKALPVVLEAKENGVRTIIESTPAWLGRDPLMLKSLSRAAGVNFITDTGYYGSNKNKYIPQSFYELDAQELADLWISEFKNGIEDTGIKPGFIKIAVDPSDTLSAEHIKIIKAAGIAHLSTGLVIASHTGPDNPAFAQIDILKGMRIDPSAFIWVHAQSGTLEGNIRAAEDGVWISLDNIRERPGTEPGARNSIEWYADRIVKLKSEGLLSRVLISHDSGWYDPAKPGGGTFNRYNDIFDSFIPVLKEKGLTDDDIDQILVKNPQEAFMVKIRKL